MSSERHVASLNHITTISYTKLTSSYLVVRCLTPLQESNLGFHAHPFQKTLLPPRHAPLTFICVEESTLNVTM